jgi:hypothetical protein
VGRSILGRRKHFIYSLLIIELPLLLVCVPSISNPSGPEAGVISALVVLAWMVAFVAVTGRSVDAVGRERAGQTLDVLLTTPLDGGEIVRQKARGAGRLAMLFWAPFLTLFLTEAWWEASHGWQTGVPNELGAVMYLVASVLSVLVFIDAASWLARWVGLKVQARTRGVLLAFLAVFSWVLLPPILANLISEVFYTDVRLLSALSPATTVWLTEYGGYRRIAQDAFGTGPLVPIVIGLAVGGIIAATFRWLCLRNADRYLGRAVEVSSGAFVPPEEETTRSSRS